MIPVEERKVEPLPATVMNPLWTEFPSIPWGSIGWRMGWGEQYWAEWSAFYLNLDTQGRTRYQDAWPEPEAWRGLYVFIETGQKPEWTEEHRRKLAGPYAVPGADEAVISDHYRVVWLVRTHMTRQALHDVRARVPRSEIEPASGEDHVEFYAERNGAWWRLSSSKNGSALLRRLASL